MDTCEVITTFVDHEKCTEHDLSILFTASTKKEAIISGYRWALNRYNTLFQNQELFQLFIRKYEIQPIEGNGYCRTFGGEILFKWRRDHSAPLTLEQTIHHIENGGCHICH